MDGLTRASESKLVYNPGGTPEVITGEDYRGISTKAEVTYCLSGDHTTIVKPFIIVEGFDPRLPNKSKGFTHYNNVVAPNSFLKMLRKDFGYDLVYVDWKSSGEYIQANAYTLISVINWINEQKAISNSKEKNGSVLKSV